MPTLIGTVTVPSTVYIAALSNRVQVLSVPTVIDLIIALMWCIMVICI